MNKPKKLTLILAFCAAAIIAVSIPLTRVQADHCHPTNGQTAAAAPQPSQPATQNRVTRAPRTRTRTALPGTNTSTQSVPAPAAAQPAVKTASIEEIYSQKLPQAILTIGEAVKAVETGDRNTELAELSKAVNMLVEIREALGKHIQQIVNSRCPIMGSAIKAETITAALTRDYKDQKVGFCCGGCPAAWDKLSDAEKQAKLSAAKS